MADAILIRQGTIAEIVTLTGQLAEFYSPYPASVYEDRFKNGKHLILVAEAEGKAVGFKAGYQRTEDGSFYSWMGGVLPEYRRRGIAEKLAERQEQWVREHGYQAIRFKTLNRHKAMLQFALGRGFHITAVESRESLPEYRIWLLKEL